MSIHAVTHAMQVKAPHPLGKLILMRFADGCEGSGEIAPDEYAEFCCTSREEIISALSDLVESGCLSVVGQNWYSLTNYEPQTFGGRRPRYVKQRIPRSVQTAVWERDGFRCKTCGVQRELSVDHIHPEIKGGTLDLDNLQTLCRPCNSRKKDRLP